MGVRVGVIGGGKGVGVKVGGNGVIGVGVSRIGVRVIVGGGSVTGVRVSGKSVGVLLGTSDGTKVGVQVGGNVGTNGVVVTVGDTIKVGVGVPLPPLQGRLVMVAGRR